MKRDGAELFVRALSQGVAARAIGIRCVQRAVCVGPFGHQSFEARGRWRNAARPVCGALRCSTGRTRRPRTALACIAPFVATTGGATARSTATTIVRSSSPIRQVPSVCGGPTGSTMSSWCSAITMRRACAIAAAPSSCMSRGGDFEADGRLHRAAPSGSSAALVDAAARLRNHHLNLRDIKKGPTLEAPGPS